MFLFIKLHMLNLICYYCLTVWNADKKQVKQQMYSVFIEGTN